MLMTYSNSSPTIERAWNVNRDLVTEQPNMIGSKYLISMGNASINASYLLTMMLYTKNFTVKNLSDKNPSGNFFILNYVEAIFRICFHGLTTENFFFCNF